MQTTFSHRTFSISAYNFGGGHFIWQPTRGQHLTQQDVLEGAVVDFILVQQLLLLDLPVPLLQLRHHRLLL